MQLSTQQAAHRANKSESTIRNWIKSEKIRAQKQAGRWLVDEQSLVSFLANSPISAKAAQKPMAAISEAQMDMIAEKVFVKVREAMEQMLRPSQEDSEPPKKSEAEEKIAALELENEKLKKQVALLEIKAEAQEKRTIAIMAEIQQLQHRQKPPEQQCELEQAQPKRRNGELRDTERAERWVRNNPEQWLDSPSGLKLAENRTWRDLAEGSGEGIEIGGRLQSSRAYLHIIEKNSQQSWHKVKAKAALEMVQKKSVYNHYAVEVGG